MHAPELLTVQNIRTSFTTPDGSFTAVEDVSFSIGRGMTLALVGESGSGKSMTALSILRLVPPPGRVVSGAVLFDGVDLLALPEPDMRALRGRRISMVFQEPMTSLNPVLRLGDQICEPLLLHKGMSGRQAAQKAAELLDRVGIAAAAARLHDYPHQLSGGQRQRVMIAMALACDPELLIADEPTTALDVTIQAQILELLDTLKAENNMATLLITHDLGIVAERAAHTCVMYAGQVVEEATTGELFSRPLHPYTRALLAALPQNAEPGRPIPSLAGHSAITGETAQGCGFCDRCPDVMPECRSARPPLAERLPGHFSRCWR